LLNSVKEKGSDGTALNTTIFKYGNQPLGFSTQSLSIFQNQSVDLFSGDFDGDGYTDILTSPVNYQGSIRYNTSLRLFCRSATNPAYSLVYNHNLPSASTVVNGMNVPNFNNLASSDFTGDGRDDIMTMNVNIGGSQNWRILDKLTLHQYSAGSFLRTFYFPPANFNLVSPSFQYFYPGDFNGDGITDFILILSNATGYKAFMTLGGATNVRNAEITGIGTSPYAAAAWAFADDIRVLDFDGDGKMELMVIDENNTKIHTFTQNGSSISTQVLYNAGFPTKYHHVYFGDFNGDRKTDLLVRGSLTNNSQAWEKAISTGTSFAVSSFSFNRTPDVVGNSGDDKIEIGDFNGDGRTDVLHGWNYTTNSDLEVYYSRGNAFTSEKYGFNGLLGFVPLTQYDLNGDGRADLINRTSFSSPSTIFYFKKEGQEQLLQTVVDGHLKRTNFSYRRMTQTSNFYSKDSFSPYPLNRVSIPIYLTQQMQEDNGNGGYYTTQYKYKDALLLRSGKGFLGFKEFEAIDLTNNVRTTLANDVVAPQVYIMVPKTIRKFVNSTNYNFNTILYNQGYVPLTNNSYWVRTNGMTEYLNLQGQTKTMSSTFDNDGNVLEEVKSDGVETITTTIAYGQFGGPRPNKPTEITVNRQRAGQLPHIVTDRYTYNNKGQVMTQVKYAGLPRQVTTLFNYNSLGNVSGKTMTALGVALRTTAQTYDSRGRFIISDTNPVGQSETATYDVKWGKPLSTTGIDGLTATYAYDGFGRLIQTTLPTGVIINESYPFFINSSYGSTYCHQVTQPGKPDQWVYFDKLGRKVRHRRKTFGNADIFEVWTYDSRGRLKTSRAPYKTGESTFTTTYNYDSYNRRISEATPFGTTSYVYSYASGIAKLTKTNPAGHVSSVEMDASGRKIKATDNGGTLTYTYDSQGEAKEIKLGGITMVTMTHDAYGNKVQVVDKNAGTISYDYNAFKEMTSQTNANGHTYNMEYNKLGQITRRQGPGEDRRYVYHTTGAAKNKLFNIYNIQSTDREYYYYDAFGRVRLKMERIDGPY
ncbi:MAG: FG-GAP-like repeat-containing protein, partial [Bacteroidota bacterium]